MMPAWAQWSALHFLRPWWLLAWLLLPMAWRWLHRRRARREAWQTAVDPHLLPHLLVPPQAEKSRGWASALAAMGAVLAVLALAGPSLHQETQPLWRSQMPLVIALDLSSASLTRDLQPNRLAQARAKLAALLRERSGGQVALVVFAEDAYTVAPLTDDAANVALFLDALAPDVMPQDGHRPDRAIGWARSLLRQAGYGRGEILLLTDAADADDWAAAAAAHGAGYRVSVLGVGTPQGGVHQTAAGPQQARLEVAALLLLALRGGGQYATLTADGQDLRSLNVLTPTATGGVAGARVTAVLRADDGYWLLPLVLLLCLPLFRRGRLLAVILACGLGLPLAAPPVQAQNVPAATGTLWRRPDQVAHAQMQAGIAAYDKRQYAQAIALLAPLPGAEAQYNLGNALARAGRFDDAIAAYARALQLQPGMQDARFNRQLVEQARRKQQQQQKPQQNSQQDPQKNGQKNGQESAPENTQRRAQQSTPQSAQENAQQDSQNRTQNNPPPAQPQSSRSQQQADAAQRQRMQAALQKQQAGQPRPAKPQDGNAMRPAETQAQREQRLADQMWLQRVPDDPGALLRARLQLEAQRRREGKP